MIDTPELMTAGAVLAGLGLPKLWARLRLSRAKHR